MKNQGWFLNHDLKYFSKKWLILVLEFDWNSNWNSNQFCDEFFSSISFRKIRKNWQKKSKFRFAIGPVPKIESKFPFGRTRRKPKPAAAALALTKFQRPLFDTNRSKSKPIRSLNWPFAARRRFLQREIMTQQICIPVRFCGGGMTKWFAKLQLLRKKSN